MMRYFLLCLFIAFFLKSSGQTYNTDLKLEIDSLRPELAKPMSDSLRARILSRIATDYVAINPDSVILYDEKAIKLYEKTNNSRSKIFTIGQLMGAYMKLGNLPKALEIGLNTIQLIENSKIYKSGAGPVYDNLGEIYYDLGDHDKSLQFYEKNILRADADLLGAAFGYWGKAMVYESIDELDSALLNLDKSRATFYRFNHSKHPDDVHGDEHYQYEVYPAWYNVRAKVYLKQNKPELALEDLRTTLKITLKSKEVVNTSNTYNDMAALYKTLNQPDSGIYYAEKGIEEAKKISYISGILNGSRILAELYNSRDPVKALQYFKLATNTEKKLYGAGNIEVMRDIISKDEKRRQDLQIAKSAYRTRLRQNILFIGLGMLLLIALILFRNNRARKKANILLTKQKKEIEDTLGQLKATQSQLIQSEKMASLGELTAGIAHEIQNPLNFVNNFSEVNTELVDELEQEADKGDIDEVKIIAKDIKENSERINQHGKRADAIVKNMLEHSRTSTGIKEPTDINKLADEYLRLAYHGLRAKDKDFKVELKTDFDETIGKINIIPQDIGRVLLNLYNNAFYAVNERLRQAQPDSHYQPTVSVSTRKEGDRVAIAVKDNGGGIPEKIKEKIFQPFFTTKPTGSGTGLGLSLSYDIVKAHGGEMKVETKENEGTEFIIQLPKYSS